MYFILLIKDSCVRRCGSSLKASVLCFRPQLSNGRHTLPDLNRFIGYRDTPLKPHKTGSPPHTRTHAHTHTHTHTHTKGPYYTSCFEYDQHLYFSYQRETYIGCMLSYCPGFVILSFRPCLLVSLCRFSLSLSISVFHLWADIWHCKVSFKCWAELWGIKI